jgi:hypothetical protein
MGDNFVLNDSPLGEHLIECQRAVFFKDSLPPASSPPTLPRKPRDPGRWPASRMRSFSSIRHPSSTSWRGTRNSGRASSRSSKPMEQGTCASRPRPSPSPKCCAGHCRQLMTRSRGVTTRSSNRGNRSRLTSTLRKALRDCERPSDSSLRTLFKRLAR